MFYKLTSISLLILCVSLSVIFGVSYYKSNKRIDELNNQLAEKQKIIQETETAWSAMAIKADNIELENKKLQKIIERKDEEIFASAKIMLQWKDKYFDILNANQTVIDPHTNTQIVEVSKECSKYRYKVEFSGEKENILVSGHTLTNPPQAYLKLQFTKALQLSLILTKENNNYRVYVDPNDPTIIPTEIDLKINPDLFKLKWYERILIRNDFGTMLNYTEIADVVPSSKIMIEVDITKNLVLSPYVGVGYSMLNMKILPLFGAQLNYYPFRN